MACKTRLHTSAVESAAEFPAESEAHAASHHDIHVELPCIDGMLMGTLALMTGYAEHQCEQGNPLCRDLMGKKIVSNLQFLATHPRLSPPMAAVMRNLQGHWHTLSALTSLESSAGAPTKAASPPSCHLRQPERPDSAQRPQAIWMPEHLSVQ